MLIRSCWGGREVRSLKGTDVFIDKEEGTDARIIEEGAEACINEETTEAYINEELTDTHIDNIDKESHTYDKEGRYALRSMKEIYVSSIEKRNLLFMWTESFIVLY